MCIIREWKPVYRQDLRPEQSTRAILSDLTVILTLTLISNPSWIACS